jgi:hypothetical protein
VPNETSYPSVASKVEDENIPTGLVM